MDEQEKTDQAFVTAHAVQCKATLLAIAAILKRRSDAVFIQSEAAEVFIDEWPTGATRSIGSQLKLRSTSDRLIGISVNRRLVPA